MLTYTSRSSGNPRDQLLSGDMLGRRSAIDIEELHRAVLVVCVAPVWRFIAVEMRASIQRMFAQRLALCTLLSLGLTGCGSSEEAGGNEGGTGGGSSSPVLLGESEVPSSLTVYGSEVWWTGVEFDGATRLAVVNRVPKAGGSVTRVASLSGTIDFFGIAADAERVAWGGFDSTVGGGSVYRAPTSGLDPVVLVPSQGAPLAVTQGNAGLFWVNLSPGAVMALPATGSPVELAADPQDSSTCIALAGSDVVWLSREGMSRISRVSTNGGASTVLVEGDAGGPISCLAADDQSVFFTRSGTSTGSFEGTYNHDGGVFKVALSGGTEEALAQGFEYPHGIAVRGEHVYFVASQDGSLRRVSKNGGTVTTLVAPTGAQDSHRTQSVVADADGVYWISARKIWAWFGQQQP
jgi:hypothetical protein